MKKKMNLNHAKKLTCVALTGVMAAVLLTGCGIQSLADNLPWAKPTAEKVLSKATTAKQAVKYETVKMNIDMGMTMTVSGYSADMTVTGDMTEDATDTDMKADCNLTVGVLGVTKAQEVQMYGHLDGSNLDLYTKVDSGSSWTKTSESYSGGALNDTNYNTFTNSLAMDDSKQDYNGTSCYKFSGTLQGDIMKQMLQDLEHTMGSSSSSLDSVDWNALNAQVTLYINAKTYLPVHMDLDFSGSDLSSLLGQSGYTTSSYQYQFSKCMITADYSNYDKTDSITIPDEVKNAK